MPKETPIYPYAATPASRAPRRITFTLNPAAYDVLFLLGQKGERPNATARRLVLKALRKSGVTFALALLVTGCGRSITAPEQLGPTRENIAKYCAPVDSTAAVTTYRCWARFKPSGK